MADAAGLFSHSVGEGDEKDVIITKVHNGFPCLLEYTIMIILVPLLLFAYAGNMLESNLTN